MTGQERITNIFKRHPVDRIGIYEHFWNDTRKLWEKEGIVKHDQTFAELFSYDLDLAWVFNMLADFKYEPTIIEQTEDTVLKLDGNGARLKYHRKHDSTPEHVGFEVTNYVGYKSKIKKLLTADEGRINGDEYLRLKGICERDNRFFMWSGVAPFECMQSLVGHENLLIGMALEPKWVLEMAMDYARVTIELLEILFSKYGKPDGLYFYEDMGYKFSPFMSPKMYKELLYPSHKYICNFAKSQKLPLMMHSCGFVEPLLPFMVDAGINALDVMENKAGVDPIRVFKNYGDKISLMGGIDVRTLYTNDKKVIDEEIEQKIPFLMKNNGYILHSDHSIPVQVKFETYQYFIEKALEIGKYRNSII